MQISFLGMTFSPHDGDFILKGVDLGSSAKFLLSWQWRVYGEEREEDLSFRLRTFPDSERFS